MTAIKYYIQRGSISSTVIKKEKRKYPFNWLSLLKLSIPPPIVNHHIDSEKEEQWALNLGGDGGEIASKVN
jgi:hypothetical protein